MCTWAEASPRRRLIPSASTRGRSSADATAAVAALPPVPMVRTNCGTPTLVDDHDGEAGADGDDRLGPLGGDRRVAQGPHQGGRHEVDTLDDEARLLGRGHDAVDQIAMGGGDQHAPGLGAVGGGVVGEDLGGEDRLVGREGDDFFGLEADRAVDVLVGDPGQVDLTRDGTQAGDADDDGLRLELPVLPQARDGVGHRREVLDLAVDDGARGQADLPEGHEHGGPGPELELGGAHRAGADVESDYLCHVADLLVTVLLPPVRGDGHERALHPPRL